MNADCHFGDHEWNGTSQCRCGARLRCMCGVYIREDNLNDHYKRCPWVERELERERREIEATWPT